MPVTFKIHKNDNYFEARQIGRMTINELIESYLSFFKTEDWHPGLNELTDLSQADLSNLTIDDVHRLSKEINTIYQQHHLQTVKNAIYAPKPQQAGPPGMYEVFGKNTSENVRVFKNKNTAIDWLLKYK